MNVLFWLGVLCAAYGLAGLAGFQFIGQEYRNRDWTKDYLHDRGVSWLLLGIPWALLGLVFTWWDPDWLVVALSMILLGCPSVLRSFRVDRKYEGMMGEEE